MYIYEVNFYTNCALKIFRMRDKKQLKSFRKFLAYCAMANKFMGDFHCEIERDKNLIIDFYELEIARARNELDSDSERG